MTSIFTKILFSLIILLNLSKATAQELRQIPTFNPMPTIDGGHSGGGGGRNGLYYEKRLANDLALVEEKIQFIESQIIESRKIRHGDEKTRHEEELIRWEREKFEIAHNNNYILSRTIDGLKKQIEELKTQLQQP